MKGPGSGPCQNTRMPVSPSAPAPSSGPVNPWQRMWTAPASTLLNLLQFGQGDRWALPLLLGAGLLSSLAPQVREALAPLLPAGTNVLNVAIVSGLVLGTLQALAWPLMLQGAAKLLGGQGTLRASRLAAAWSSLPVLVSYLLSPLLYRQLGGRSAAGRPEPAASAAGPCCCWCSRWPPLSA